MDIAIDDLNVLNGPCPPHGIVQYLCIKNVTNNSTPIQLILIVLHFSLMPITVR